uniref:Pollen allergen Sal k 1 (Fragments) n=1 Tax=Salsola kali TaxID=151250 RepID=POA1_SALKA|nr:RecName: Full=Pollen allergen Sal k 1; AltName: Allergen=Sal k 1 [Kali turgidum]
PTITIGGPEYRTIFFDAYLGTSYVIVIKEPAEEFTTISDAVK